MSDDTGTIQGSAGARRVEVRRTIPAPIGEVWQALVEAEAVSEWFAPAVIEAREGGRLQLRFPEAHVTGVIKSFVPPNVFTYTWEQEGESTSLVHFDLIELSPTETRVTVIQTALDPGVAGEVRGGWNTMLDRMARFVCRDRSVG